MTTLESFPVECVIAGTQIRYTVTLNADDLADAVAATMRELGNRGYPDGAEAKTAWDAILRLNRVELCDEHATLMAIGMPWTADGLAGFTERVLVERGQPAG